MRIAFDLTPVWRRETGIIVYALELVRAWATSYPRDGLVAISSSPVPESLRALPGNVEVVETGSRREMANRLLHIRRIVNRLRPEVVHFPISPPTPALSAPFSMTVHDATAWLFGDTMRTSGRLYFRYGWEIGARRAGRIFTYSSDSAQRLRRLLPSAEAKVVVTPLAARKLLGDGDLDPGPLLIGDHPYIMTVATLEPRKNLDVVLGALPHLAQLLGDKVVLVLAGREGWRNDSVFKRVQTCVDLGYVSRVGFVSDDMLGRLYKHARVVIAPSLFEGFDLPTIEAAAAGAPILASDIPVHREVLGDSAAYFDPSSEMELAAKLAGLWTDSGRLAALSQLGTAHAASYSWRRTAEITRGALVEMLESA